MPAFYRCNPNSFEAHRIVADHLTTLKPKFFLQARRVKNCCGSILACFVFSAAPSIIIKVEPVSPPRDCRTISRGMSRIFSLSTNPMSEDIGAGGLALHPPGGSFQGEDGNVELKALCWWTTISSLGHLSPSLINCPL